MSIKEVSKNEALELLANHQIMIVDARDSDEIDELLTEDAINLSLNNKDHFDMMVSMLDKDLEYLVYSENGVSSLRVAKALCELGFTNVYNLTEGLVGLRKEGCM